MYFFFSPRQQQIPSGDDDSQAALLSDLSVSSFLPEGQAITDLACACAVTLTSPQCSHSWAFPASSHVLLHRCVPDSQVEGDAVSSGHGTCVVKVLKIIQFIIQNTESKSEKYRLLVKCILEIMEF